MTPTVYVVDDDADIGMCLEALLLSNGLICRVFDSSRKFLREFDPQCPGCVLLDLRLPEINGLQVLKALKARGAETPVLFLSGCADVASVALAMRSGAVDFLEKSVADEVLIARVRESITLDARRRASRAELELRFERFTSLTVDELEVVKRLALGEAIEAIARQLATSEKKVERHRDAALRKTGARSEAQLAAWYVHAHDTGTSGA